MTALGWTAFGAASLALMGASVWGGACRYAADNLAPERREGSRFLERGDAPARRPLDERVAALASWMLCALWGAFGLALFWEPR